MGVSWQAAAAWIYFHVDRAGGNVEITTSHVVGAYCHCSDYLADFLVRISGGCSRPFIHHWGESLLLCAVH